MLLSNRLDFSQYGQPAFIRRFIPPEAVRWLVDVGAHDGIQGSNSRGFVLEEWAALLIEPLPSVFETLRANSEGLGKVRLERCACAEFEGDAKFHIGRDGPDGQTSSLCEDDGWKHNHSGEEIAVRVRTLTNLLTEHNFPRDFALLLVDAEGMDFEVLSGLDFSRFRPAVICTEVYEANAGKHERKAELLERSGYRFRGRVGSDAIWSSNNLDLDTGLFAGEDLPLEARLPVYGEGVAAFDRANAAGGDLTVTGWAFAPDQTVPGLILVGVKTSNGFHWLQSERCFRPDVAQHFGSQELRFSGFRARFRLRTESPVQVFLVQVQRERRWDNIAYMEIADGWL